MIPMQKWMQGVIIKKEFVGAAHLPDAVAQVLIAVWKVTVVDSQRMMLFQKSEIEKSGRVVIL
jgi:hypothetical protein